MAAMEEKYLFFGGTGALGKVLVRRLLHEGKKVAVFSRDEAKHHAMRIAHGEVETIIGDVRDYRAVLDAVYKTKPTHIINAAAMKQIPLCEDFPYETVQTNVVGTQNVTRAAQHYAREKDAPVRALYISTDKACKPVNSYGMTKALAERIHLIFNEPPKLVCTCVRYGNVLESTGSVIPIFKEKIKNGEPIYVTDAQMTRFWLNLEQAVNLIFDALADTEGGTIYVPKVPAARVVDVAECLAEDAGKVVTAQVSGIRPGEKLNEILLSEEELPRVEERVETYVIHDIRSKKKFDTVKEEYSSGKHLMDKATLKNFLKQHHVI
jgi:UDP-glucose 4-epimerase